MYFGVKRWWLRLTGLRWRGKKCPILIFQYVIELEKTNKMKKREVNLTSPSRDIVPQKLRFTYNCIGSLNH